MKRCSPWFVTGRALALLACLAFLFGQAQPGPGLAAPSSQVVPLRKLTIFPLDEGRQVCVGVNETYNATIVDVMKPVPKAKVMVDGKAYTSGKDGGVRWSQKFNDTGEKTMTITATKADYQDADPVTVKVTVKACSWNIRMDYNEEYLDYQHDYWVFQGSAEMDPASFGLSDNGNLVLLSLESSLPVNYHANVYLFNRAMRCTFSPPFEGVYPVKFGGKYNGQIMTINLSASSVKLPKVVKIQCVALDEAGNPDPNYTIAPLNFPTRQKFDLINTAKLNKLVFSSDGGVKRFKLTQLQLWPLKLGGTSAYASGVIVVERNKK